MIATMIVDSTGVRSIETVEHQIDVSIILVNVSDDVDEIDACDEHVRLIANDCRAMGAEVIIRYDRPVVYERGESG